MRHWIAALAVGLALPAGAAEIGDDGLHKAPWMVETFKDLREDLAEATAEGRRLMVIVEQRGCIYCTKMHEEVFSQPDIAATLGTDYFVVQLNMFGDVEVVDFDGEILSEKAAVRKWGLNFTPLLLFFPEEVPEGVTAEDAAVATVPGAFGAETTRNMLSWVLEKGYAGDEPFQVYHARKLNGG
ncbi:hypothetical protein JANAI62_34480 [Jannaschia pagri]|uniref:Thioredoxin-like fold domain-containing protein n=1 Tax=Jannaschia pagri TaxID=2829797 RepID=A0ABQ4NRC3_9RHOB|nr:MULTISPECIES: thioredoxin family protein [unclassified Jannaschia]GIT92990.1 hypothetical protein JANAI61_34480 [Jannaschia sp. AI_61]GIT96825.1 hypothetical protein JANAI62_34480 [Jannaschia sp. AI_62]